MVNKVFKKTTTSHLEYFLLFLYFVSISAFRLGVGFDAVFVRIMFIVMLASTLFMKKRLFVSGAFVWNFCYWVLFFASALWASNPDFVFDKTAIFVQIIGLFFFLPFYMTDKKSFNVALKVLVCSLIATAAILFIRTPLDAVGIERLGDFVGLNSNALGFRMAIGAIVSLHLLHNTDKAKRRTKLLYAAVMLLFLAIVLLSGSRKALFAIAAGFVIYETAIARGVRTLAKIMGIVVAVLATFVLIFNNEQLYELIGARVERTFTAVESGVASSADHSMQERQFYINQALELFTEHPILGYGGNNFAAYMSEINYSHVAYSHNNYTEILADLGIVGFVVYYCFWAVIAFCIFRQYVNERKNGQYKTTTLLALILISILAVLDYGMVSYDAEFNMVVLCLVYVCWALNKRNDNLGVNYEKDS